MRYPTYTRGEGVKCDQVWCGYTKGSACLHLWEVVCETRDTRHVSFLNLPELSLERNTVTHQPCLYDHHAPGPTITCVSSTGFLAAALIVTDSTAADFCTDVHVGSGCGFACGSYNGTCTMQLVSAYATHQGTRSSARLTDAPRCSRCTDTCR